MGLINAESTNKLNCAFYHFKSYTITKRTFAMIQRYHMTYTTVDFLLNNFRNQTNIDFSHKQKHKFWYKYVLKYDKYNPIWGVVFAIP